MQLSSQILCKHCHDYKSYVLQCSDISSNSIGPEGAIAIIEGLKAKKGMTELVVISVGLII